MSFTCVTCALEFGDGPQQRIHMKSEWHRYNLKRRVSQLPSISEAVFNLKIAQMGQEPKRDPKRERLAEIRQRKAELLAQARLQLENSPEKETQGENPKEAAAHEALEPTQEDLIAEKLRNKVDIPATTCLFCPTKANQVFGTVDENIEHMFKAHGLYVPERKYLVDKEGLISYLGEKIGFGNVCLVCLFQGRSLEAIRNHMAAKRHMRIPYETEEEKLEISDFYDFTASYDAATPAAESVSDAEGSGSDWEDVSDLELEFALVSENELVLPSGRVVGHRRDMRYFRQHPAPAPVLLEGHGTVISAETRHFIGIQDRKMQQLQRVLWRAQRSREDTNDRRAAKHLNHQPHYRDQLLQ